MVAVDKTKQYLFAVGKVLVLAITFGYIFYKLKNNPDLDFFEFTNSVFSRGVSAGYFIVIFLFLTALNWYFEILKWQKLVGSFKKISFKTSLKQCLTSLTISLATPNRIGEYGAKALFFKTEKRKKILLLNFYSNLNQLGATLLFGFIGIFYFFETYEISYSTEALFLLGIASLTAGLIAYYFREEELLLKGFSIGNILRFYKELPASLKVNIFIFSLCRYATFTLMFYGMLLFFGTEIEIGTALALIFTMYFMVSVIPTIFIFDVVVRGGIAVWLFSFVGVPELAILYTVLAMWIFNFVIPSIIGSFFILVYQPATR